MTRWLDYTRNAFLAGLLLLAPLGYLPYAFGLGDNRFAQYFDEAILLGFIGSTLLDARPLRRKLLLAAIGLFVIFNSILVPLNPQGLSVTLYGWITYMLVAGCCLFPTSSFSEKYKTWTLYFAALALLVAAAGLFADYVQNFSQFLNVDVTEDQSVMRLSVLLDGTVRPSFYYVSTTNAAVTICAIAALLVTAAFSKVHRSRTETLVVFAGLILGAFAVALTMARTGYVVYALILAVALLRGENWIKLVYGISAFGLAVALLIYVASAGPSDPFVRRLNAITGKEARLEEANQLRVEQWLEGLRAIPKTWPVGKGLGMANPKNRIFIRVDHYESSLLGFLIETGLGGALTGLFLLVACLLECRHRAWVETACTVVLCVGVPLIIMSVAPFLSNYVLIVIMGLTFGIGARNEGLPVRPFLPVRLPPSAGTK